MWGMCWLGWCGGDGLCLGVVVGGCSFVVWCGCVVVFVYCRWFCGVGYICVLFSVLVDERRIVVVLVLVFRLFIGCCGVGG